MRVRKVLLLWQYKHNVSPYSIENHTQVDKIWIITYFVHGLILKSGTFQFKVNNLEIKISTLNVTSYLSVLL